MKLVLSFILKVFLISLILAPLVSPLQARTSIGIRYDRAMRLLQDGNLSESLRLLEEIDGLNPFIPEVKNNLGYVYENLGNRDLAIKYYRQAIEINGNFAPALNNLGYLTGMTGQDLEKAIEMVEKAVAINALSASYRDSLGNLYLKAGDIPRARLNFEKGLLLDPDSLSIRQSLVRVLYQDKKYSQCLETLEKLPQNFSTELIRYHCLKSLTRYTEALEVLRGLKKLSDAEGVEISDLEALRAEMKVMVALSVSAGLEALSGLPGRRADTGLGVTDSQMEILKGLEGDIFKAASNDMASARYGLNVMLFEKVPGANLTADDSLKRDAELGSLIQETEKTRLVIGEVRAALEAKKRKSSISPTKIGLQGTNESGNLSQ